MYDEDGLYCLVLPPWHMSARFVVLTAPGVHLEDGSGRPLTAWQIRNTGDGAWPELIEVGSLWVAQPASARAASASTKRVGNLKGCVIAVNEGPTIPV